MPVTIKIPTALRQYADNKTQLDTSAGTVGEALAQLMNAHNELHPHLYREGNELRNFINVYLNDEDIRHLQGLESAAKDGDVITIVPSIAGGLDATVLRKKCLISWKVSRAKAQRCKELPRV
jgi:molybdopterin converting factor small subunit